MTLHEDEPLSFLDGHSNLLKSPVVWVADAEDMDGESSWGSVQPRMSVLPLNAFP